MIYGIILGISIIAYGLTSSYIPLLAGLIAITIIVLYPQLSKLKSKIVKLKPKLPVQGQSPKKKSWETVKGLAVTAIVVIALVFLVILPIHASLTRTKTVSYLPKPYSQTVCVGKAGERLHFQIRKTYYELPPYRIFKNKTALPTTGARYLNPRMNLPLKLQNYYGGILANGLPNNSVVRLDPDGCVEIKLNIPPSIRTVRASHTSLIFTRL